MPSWDRGTIVSNEPLSKSLNDCFWQPLSTIVERSFPMILVFDRWPIVSNDPRVRSLSDRFQRFLFRTVDLSFPPIRFYARWTIIFNDHLFRSINNRFQRSLISVVERSFSRTSFNDRWTIVFNDTFLASSNDRFQRSRLHSSNIVSNDPYLDLCTIVPNDSFWRWSLNYSLQQSLFTIVVRSFPPILFHDRWTIASNDAFLG